MTPRVKKKVLCLFLVIFFAVSSTVKAEIKNINVSKLLPHSAVSFSPRAGSFVEDSVFEVPIILDTKGSSVNSIEVRINFDKDKLSIVKPSTGLSIIGLWLEPPHYDNDKGTASYVGIVPNGIITESGLIGTITFKAIHTGPAVVRVTSNSSVLLNDGLGTNTLLDLGRAAYVILPKAPDGVRIFSETHPSQDDWYNNKNPVLSWERDDGVTGFSFVFDHEPNTIPDNIIDTADTSKSFENLNDGLWYFHIKAIKDKVWGTTGVFLVKIDTTPPADFKPVTNYLSAATVLFERVLVSFFTTDNLSGIDHYEVGVIDKNQPPTESPVFVQAETPFQVPLSIGGKFQVVVRAIDKAGNVRDASVTVGHGITIFNIVMILIAMILLGFALLLVHYSFGHHVATRFRKMWQIMKQGAKDTLVKEIKDITNEDQKPTQ